MMGDVYIVWRECTALSITATNFGLYHTTPAATWYVQTLSWHLWERGLKLNCYITSTEKAWESLRKPEKAKHFGASMKTKCKWCMCVSTNFCHITADINKDKQQVERLTCYLSSPCISEKLSMSLACYSSFWIDSIDPTIMSSLSWSSERYSFRHLLGSWVVQACWAEPGEPPVICWPPLRLVWSLCASDGHLTGSFEEKATVRRCGSTEDYNCDNMTKA